MTRDARRCFPTTPAAALVSVVPSRLGMVLALAALAIAGCGKTHVRFKHPRLMNEADCAACLEVALDSESPDARREAVVHISKTSRLSNDIVVRALSCIARTDPSESVRYAAVRALGKSAVPAAIDPLIEVISAPDGFEEVTEPRAGEVRWAALDGLDPQVAHGGLSDDQRAACHVAAIRLLGRHPSRDVRIAAARLLRHFQTVEAVTALVDALDQRDFGVVYHSDRSLMHLTGRCFDHDPRSWRQWLAATGDPFADAGRLDHKLHPPRESWWARTINATRQTFAGFRPKQETSPRSIAEPGN